MAEKYYTVEQIASMLNMHPKTIQKYIREGKLKANKVGKSWRVTGHDLSVFTEGTRNSAGNSSDPHSVDKTTDDKVKISSVIDINVNDMDEAMRIVNMLTAVLNTKPQEYGKSTMNAQYLEPELKVRIMLWGNIKFMETMISSISVLIENNPGDHQD